MRRIVNFLLLLLVLGAAGGAAYWIATVPQPARTDVQMVYARDFVAYQYGKFTASSETDVTTSLRFMADKGNLYAGVLVGEMLFKQGAADHDAYQKSLVYIQAAAEMGIPAAQNALGTAYQHGLGTERNLVSAYQWYKLAADCHDARARRNLFDVSTDISTAQVDTAIKAADEWLAAYKTKKLDLGLFR